MSHEIEQMDIYIQPLVASAVRMTVVEDGTPLSPLSLLQGDTVEIQGKEGGATIIVHLSPYFPPQPTTSWWMRFLGWLPL